MFEISTANIVGIIALSMTAVALTRRSNDGLLATLGLAVLLWAVHYWLLGSCPGRQCIWWQRLACSWLTGCRRPQLLLAG